MRLQTEAVLSIQALPPGTVDLIRSPAQLLENSLNPVQSRRDAVDLWLSQSPVAELPESDLLRRTEELLALGFKNFDSFHIACAELARANVFLTVDIRILRAAARHGDALSVRILDPVKFVEEISQ